MILRDPRLDDALIAAAGGGDDFTTALKTRRSGHLAPDSAWLDLSAPTLARLGAERALDLALSALDLAQLSGTSRSGQAEPIRVRLERVLAAARTAATAYVELIALTEVAPTTHERHDPQTPRCGELTGRPAGQGRPCPRRPEGEER